MIFPEIFQNAIGAHQCRLLLRDTHVVGYAVGNDPFVLLDEPIVFAPRVVWSAAIIAGFRERSAELGRDAETGCSVIFYDATLSEVFTKPDDGMTTRQRRATAIKQGDMRDQRNQERRLREMYTKGLAISS